MKTGISKSTSRTTFENATPSTLHTQERLMSWCFVSQCLCHGQEGFGTRSQHSSWEHGGKSATLHPQLAASTHTAELGRATTISTISTISVWVVPSSEGQGGKGRMRWRWPDILRLQRWRCAGQNGGTPCPIPGSQHTGSLLWLHGRKHLPRLKQVRLVQNRTVKKLALDEISRYTGLWQAITIQRTITILTSSLHIWSAKPKTKPLCFQFSEYFHSLDINLCPENVQESKKAKRGHATWSLKCMQNMYLVTGKKSWDGKNLSKNRSVPG